MTCQPVSPLPPLTPPPAPSLSSSMFSSSFSLPLRLPLLVLLLLLLLLCLLLLLPLLLDFGTLRSSDISCWQKTEGGKIRFLFFGQSLLLLLLFLLLLAVGEELTLEEEPREIHPRVNTAGG